MGYTITLVGTVFLIVIGSTMIYGFHISVMNLISENFRLFMLSSTTGKSASRDSLKDTNIRQQTSFYLGLVNSLFIVGGMIGSFGGGFLGDLVGRKKGILIINVVDIVGAVCMFLCRSVHYIMIYIGRFIGGLGCGITLSIAFMYLMEIAPTSKRGFIGAFGQLSITSGILFGNILTFELFFNRLDSFHQVFLAPCIPCGITLCLLPFCPESPRYLALAKSNQDKAMEAHSKFNNEESPEDFLKTAIEEQENAAKQPKFKFTQIFNAAYRKPLLIACLLQIMQQLSGINAVMTYSSVMIKGAGVEDPYALQYFVAGISLFNVICTIVTLPLLEVFGRRSLMLWPSILVILTLGLLTITVTLGNSYPSMIKATSLVAVVLIFLYVAGFAFGLGCVPGLYVSEIFRQAPRATAYSISQGLQWTCNLMVTFTYPILEGPLRGFVFMPYMVVVIIIEIYLFFAMPETKGRSFDEIASGIARGTIFTRQRSSEDEE